MFLNGTTLPNDNNPDKDQIEEDPCPNELRSALTFCEFALQKMKHFFVLMSLNRQRATDLAFVKKEKRLLYTMHYIPNAISVPADIQ